MSALNPTRARLLEMYGLDVMMVEGEACRLKDTSGRDYLDFLSQYGALPFGHNPSDIWKALISAQTSMAPSMVQPLRSNEAERLAERLAAITPFDLGIVTLANSGAEAVEASIKLARARTGRNIILSASNGFHGKTLGALSATGKSLYQKDFGAPANAFDYVPFGDIVALKGRFEAQADKIAAFIVEPIQGEGGVICPPDDYLASVIALCREHGVLCVVDEIQTGLGRTGRLFACEDCTAAPDMLLLGKALGGGLMPIAACIARPSVWDDRFGTLHSSTFANNTLACAAANAALDRLTANGASLISHVADNGRYLQSRLQDLHKRYPNVIRGVRGRGFMAGLEFREPIEKNGSGTMAFCSLNGGFIAILSSYLLNVEGILTAPVFNDAHVMRLQPPLIAGRAEIDQCINALDTVCHLLEHKEHSAILRHLVAPERRKRIYDTNYVQPQKGPMRDISQVEGARFCFLIHYTEEEDLLKSDPSFASFSLEERSAWLQFAKQIGPGFAWPVPQSRSRTGATVEGMIMSVPLLPSSMLGKGRSSARTMIKDAADMAVEYGANRLGLGAFTSIVTNGGSAIAGRGTPVTSGNTLTTVVAVTAIERVAKRVGMDLSDAHVVVVGATGAIGRLASLMLARRVGRLSLVGNARNQHAPKLVGKVADEVTHVLLAEEQPFGAGGLWNDVRSMLPAERAQEGKGLAESLNDVCFAQGKVSPLVATTDLDASLATADVVLVATSADIALVDPMTLKPGTIVCDVARPPNVAMTDLGDHDVLVFDGGLVQPPFPLDLGPFQTLPKNLAWGCLGETMLLALEGETSDYSLGRDLSLPEADRIAEMARKHGFAPAEPQWGGRLLNDADFARVSAVYEHRFLLSGSKNVMNE
ncbi:aminotransferase class III-fold pyridoxal phosphate-dependent enzyme [Roseovarius sp. D22-M7]|uniref:aminotransferase class III-fold pyridoxal phosphate-dependent enzyme n=1 Tax=Roseovarius sp. D22-M7 TaxID=3127116 RepID=UPI0030100D2E